MVSVSLHNSGTGETGVTKRYWIAGLVGGLAMYVWMSIAHIATPLGATGVSMISGEEPLLTSMTAVLGDKPGLYMFPSMDPAAPMQEYEKKLAANPSGLLIYRRAGGLALEPTQLVGELIAEIVMVLLGVWLLSKAALSSFGARLGFFCIIGLVASLWTNFSYWNWYTFPTSYTVTSVFTEFVGFLVAGLVIAGMLGRGQSMRTVM
jgi:hypothetical protein